MSARVKSIWDEYFQPVFDQTVSQVNVTVAKEIGRLRHVFVSLSNDDRSEIVQALTSIAFQLKASQTNEQNSTTISSDGAEISNTNERFSQFLFFII